MKAKINQRVSVIGMLHIVEVRMIRRDTGEKIKHKLLMVGCQASDIESKLNWVFDRAQYSEMSIKSIEKVREKIHTLSTTVTQVDEPTGPTIKTPEGSKQVTPVAAEKETYDPKLFAIGLATTMMAADENHAMRKVAKAIIARTTSIKSGGPQLSDDAVLTVEQVPLSSGFSGPRDTTNEANRASFVSGGLPGSGRR